MKKIEEIESELVDLLKELYKPSEVESKELIKVIRVGEPSERATRLMYLEAKNEINIISKCFEYYPKVRKELIEASGELR